MSDYVKLNRSLLDWEWFQDSHTTHVLIYLMLDVNWRPGRFMGIDVPPGSTITSREKISKGTGLSEKAVRVALDKLEKCEAIERIRAGNGQLVTLVNWGKYQAEEDNRGRPGAGDRADLGPTKGQRKGRLGATIEEGKKEKKEIREEVREPKGSGQKAQPSIPFEPMNGKEDPAEAGAAKPDPRDPEVQAVIDHLVLRLRERGVASLDVDRISTKTGRSLDMNRAHAKNLLAKLAKDYPEYNPLASAKALIDFAARHEYYGPKCTKVAYLYRNLGTLAGEARAAKNAKPKTHADLAAGVEQILRAKYGPNPNGSN